MQAKASHKYAQSGRRQRDSARRFAADESQALDRSDRHRWVRGSGAEIIAFPQTDSRCDRAEAHNRSGRLVGLTKPRFSRLLGLFFLSCQCAPCEDSAQFFNKKEYAPSSRVRNRRVYVLTPRRVDWVASVPIRTSGCSYAAAAKPNQT